MTTKKKTTQKHSSGGSSSSRRSAPSAKRTSASLSSKPNERAVPRAAHAPAQAETDTRLLNDSIKNDLIGLFIAVMGIVLFVIVIIPTEAIGARLISDGMRLLVGVGAFILPFVLIIWGVGFFLKRRFTYAPLRLIIGLALIFIGIISLFASATPQAATTLEAIFDPSALVNQGGYIGGGFAWAGLALIGAIATNIIFCALILAGTILIGFSINGLIAKISVIINRRKEHSEEEIPYQGAYNMGPKVVSSDKAVLLTPTRLKTTPAGADDAFTMAFEDGEHGAMALETTADLGVIRRSKANASLDDAALSHEGPDRLVAIRNSKGNGFEGDKVDEPAQARGKEEPQEGKRADVAASAGSVAMALSSYGDFEMPDMQVLKVSRDKATTKAGIDELRATAAHLQATLEEFSVEGEVIGWIAGPTVTLYKVTLGEGVRLNRITNLQDDIQLALAALAIRIVAPIPGTSLVGIEVPNETRNTVLLGDVLPAAQPGPLQLAIGKDVEGDAITVDLSTMPHLLIGGTTGSGKSVAINAIIMSILMRATPGEVRMILIDPKRVELSLYNGIPHLYVPVVTDPSQAASALSWSVLEMERRLKLFEKHGAKNIRQFNSKVTAELARLAAEEGSEQQGQEQEQEQDHSDDVTIELTASDVDSEQDTEILGGTGKASASQDSAQSAAALQDDLKSTMPYIVIVIDELADLMMAAGKEIEFSISRLAQLARAAGLHLIVATQRPSTNVITGLIKANIVNRIAFTVASGIDSRVILDTPGAEDLIGLGDLLFSRPEYSKPMRIQGCLVTEPEIETVVNFLRSQGEPDYHEDILCATSSGFGGGVGMGGAENAGDDDPLLWDAADIVVSSGLGSTSTLQRRLKVGYARAGRIMDMLEMKGIVGPPNGSKPREVLIDDVLDLETLKAFERAD